MHTEDQAFQNIDRYFKGLMKKTVKRSQVTKATVKSPTILADLRKQNASIEQLQKQLSKYLELKRRAFARLYFISDEDLLSMLASSNDLQQIQPYLKKFYENIYRVIVDYEVRAFEIEGVESQEGEQLLFLRVVRTKSSIEDWLAQLQKAIAESLNSKIMDIYKDCLLYTSDAADE